MKSDSTKGTLEGALNNQSNAQSDNAEQRNSANSRASVSDLDKLIGQETVKRKKSSDQRTANSLELDTALSPEQAKKKAKQLAPSSNEGLVALLAILLSMDRSERETAVSSAIATLELIGHPDGDASSRMALNNNSDPLLAPPVLETLMRLSRRMHLDRSTDDAQQSASGLETIGHFGKMMLSHSANEKTGLSSLETIDQFTKMMKLIKEKAPELESSVLESFMAASTESPNTAPNPERNDSPASTLETIDSFSSMMSFLSSGDLLNSGNLSSLESLVHWAISKPSTIEATTTPSSSSTLNAAGETTASGFMHLTKTGIATVQTVKTGLDGLMDIPVLSTDHESNPGPKAPQTHDPAPPLPTHHTTATPSKAQRGLKQQVLIPNTGKTELRWDYRYGKFEKLVIHRPLLTSSKSPESPQSYAQTPRFASSGRLGNGLLAQVVAFRYFDHISLEQISRIISRLGHTFTPRQLSRWVDQAAAHVHPVYHHLEQGVLKTKGHTCGEAITAFQGRSTGVLQALENKAGAVIQFSEAALETNGTSQTLQALFAGHQGRAVNARWGGLHIRLFAALLTEPTPSRKGIRVLLDAWPSQETAAQEKLKSWLDKEKSYIDAPSNVFETAITYGSGCWNSMMGEQPSQAKGRRNNYWIIGETEGSLTSAATFYTLTQRCGAQGFYPWQYLRKLFDVYGNDPESSPEKWTPAAWAKAHLVQ